MEPAHASPMEWCEGNPEQGVEQGPGSLLERDEVGNCWPPLCQPSFAGVLEKLGTVYTDVQFPSPTAHQRHPESESKQGKPAKGKRLESNLSCRTGYRIYYAVPCIPAR
jgi:hypothetical protein